jgi:hypoxanthine phosphoribosyltransferase
MTMQGDEQIQAISDQIKPLPAGWESTELDGMLISASEIQSRVKELAIQIQSQLPIDEPIVVLPLLSGSFLFAADLVRHWQFKFELDFIGISSYRQSTQPGQIEWTHKVKTDITHKHVLIIDDILDTGKTLNEAKGELSKKNPAAIHTCVLLEKCIKTHYTMRCQADFTGFKIPNHFVVGYGLDFALKFRQLPFVGILSPNCYGTETDRYQS